ncbi:hypothetical protein MIND_00898300 [Mycena indigotica]|uniref:Uncharacterized protein n=1 Tax=Mycena indigotica TaxID=2126181 RepID=A0A8H6SII6_9AGAR|nr:uncharacterized protein MIND_00898300 [Mycena indigotica]KAF7299482.1 hypothetical protein MIND_00898300 [Mycena indigotica]
MAANIVLPPLKLWAQQHLTSMLKAAVQGQAAFNDAFNAFISKDAKITLNGKQVSHDAYKRAFEAAFGVASVDVKLDETVAVADADSNYTGLVGLFYTETARSKDLVHDVPRVLYTIDASVNILVEEDKSLHAPHLPHGIHGDFDGRRVMSVNQISLETHQPAPRDA